MKIDIQWAFLWSKIKGIILKWCLIYISNAFIYGHESSVCAIVITQTGESLTLAVRDQSVINTHVA